MLKCNWRVTPQKVIPRLIKGHLKLMKNKTHLVFNE